MLHLLYPILIWKKSTNSELSRKSLGFGGPTSSTLHPMLGPMIPHSTAHRLCGLKCCLVPVLMLLVIWLSIMKQVFSNAHVGLWFLLFPWINTIVRRHILVSYFRLWNLVGKFFRDLHFFRMYSFAADLKVKLKEKYWPNGVLYTFGSPVICAM